MLVNHIKVYQQADVESIEEEAGRTNNVTGVGGPVPGDPPRLADDPRKGNVASRRAGGGSMGVVRGFGCGLVVFVLVVTPPGI